MNQTEQKQPTKFSDLYTRINTHLEQHSGIEIIGRKMRTPTISYFCIEYYVAPRQEMNGVGKLNELLNSLIPQGTRPNKRIKFKARYPLRGLTKPGDDRKRMELGSITYLISIGEGTQLLPIEMNELKAEEGYTKVLEPLGFNYHEREEALKRMRNFDQGCSVYGSLDNMARSFDDIKGSALTTTYQFTGGICVRLFPSKEYAKKVFLPCENEVDILSLFQCWVVKGHAIPEVGVDTLERVKRFTK